MTGLTNIGNTCFMNSAIQCLVHMTELNNNLNGVYDKQHVLLNEYNDLRKLMGEGHTSIQPRRFVAAIHYVAKQKNMDFVGQQDLPEFLLFMLDSIHMSLSHPAEMVFTETNDKILKACQTMMKRYEKEYSIIIDLLYGIHVSHVGDSVTPELFCMLDLPIPNENSTLQDCLDEYCKPEMVDWYNEATKEYVPSQKRLSIIKYPPLLFITLKRFTNKNKKNNSKIEVPLIMKFNSDYELIWCCNHQGSPMGGHYTCSVKTDKWRFFDDDQIQEIPEEHLISPNTYCLLFRKM